MQQVQEVADSYRGVNSFASMPARYLPIEGAAKYASVSTKTIQRWIKAGLPVYQGTIRGRVLIRPTDIDLYLTRRQARQINLDAIVNEVLLGVQGEKLAA
jgi:hypothetical protein